MRAQGNIATTLEPSGLSCMALKRSLPETLNRSAVLPALRPCVCFMESANPSGSAGIEAGGAFDDPMGIIEATVTGLLETLLRRIGPSVRFN